MNTRHFTGVPYKVDPSSVQDKLFATVIRFACTSLGMTGWTPE